MLGSHGIKSRSSTQDVVAWSSGEAEFYASVKAAAMGLGLQNLMKDMGRECSAPAINLWMDATAGIGVASRLGAGRIRHIETPTLWVQRVVQDKRILLHKVEGAINPANANTKFVDEKELTNLLRVCSFRQMTGSSEQALRAQLQ